LRRSRDASSQIANYSSNTPLIYLAAAYGVAVAKAHAFQDGNKRTAVLAIDAFLYLNGVNLDLSSSQLEGVRVFKEVASSQRGINELAKWLRKYTQDPNEVFSSLQDNMTQFRIESRK